MFNYWEFLNTIFKIGLGIEIGKAAKDTAKEGCSLGCFGGCLKNLIFLGAIVYVAGVVNRCIGGNDPDLKNQNSTRVAYLTREISDTIRENGRIIDIRHIDTADIKITFEKDRFYLVTPYKCYKPAFVFTFYEKRLNKLLQKEEEEHVYYMQEEKHDSCHYRYFINKDIFPNFDSEYSSSSHSDLDFHFYFYCADSLKVDAESINYAGKEPDCSTLRFMLRNGEYSYDLMRSDARELFYDFLIKH